MAEEPPPLGQDDKDLLRKLGEDFLSELKVGDMSPFGTFLSPTRIWESQNASERKLDIASWFQIFWYTELQNLE